MPVLVWNKFHKCPPGLEIDTTSHGGVWKDLSPFYLGPLSLYDGLTAQRMENAWQYSKVYSEHVDISREPTDLYWQWATKGWANRRAIRYPMGKGRTPLYSLWKGKKLDYISARKTIYVPLYAMCVVQTAGWQRLSELHQKGETIILKDFDGYNEGSQYLSWVLNNPNKKMGHAFVLKMLLTDDPVLRECFSLFDC